MGNSQGSVGGNTFGSNEIGSGKNNPFKGMPGTSGSGSLGGGSGGSLFGGRTGGSGLFNKNPANELQGFWNNHPEEWAITIMSFYAGSQLPQNSPFYIAFMALAASGFAGAAPALFGGRMQSGAGQQIGMFREVATTVSFVAFALGGIQMLGMTLSPAMMGALGLFGLMFAMQSMNTGRINLQAIRAPAAALLGGSALFSMTGAGSTTGMTGGAGGSHQTLLALAGLLGAGEILPLLNNTGMGHVQGRMLIIPAIFFAMMGMNHGSSMGGGIGSGFGSGFGGGMGSMMGKTGV